MNERMISTVNVGVQRTLGPWAEPVAKRLARKLVGAVEGERDVHRLGLDWSLDLTQNHERELYLVGSYEASTLRHALSLLRPGDLVFDVGANIGTFCLPVAARGYDVVAVEPATDTSARLASHIARNGLGGTVRVHHGALGDHAGHVDLRTGRTADSGLRTVGGDGELVERVPVLQGDELVRQIGRVPSVVKIDVEGSELDVLRGLSNSLADIRAVIVEMVESNQERSGRTSEQLTELLESAGFVRGDIRSTESRPRLGRGGHNVVFRNQHC